jgi:hypothetical protein
VGPPWNLKKEEIDPNSWTTSKTTCDEIGHYTQLLWKTTTDIGCAMADESKSGERGILGCQYGESGNFEYTTNDGTCPTYAEYVPYPPTKTEEQCIAELGITKPDMTPQCEWGGNWVYTEMVRAGEIEWNEALGGCVSTGVINKDCNFEKVLVRGVCVPEGYEGAPPHLPSSTDQSTTDKDPNLSWNLPWYQPPARNTVWGRSGDKKVMSHKAWVNEVLLTHNRLRCMHGAPPLQWSDELEAHADSWVRFSGPLEDIMAGFASPVSERRNLGGFEFVSQMTKFGFYHRNVLTPGKNVEDWYQRGLEFLPGGKVNLEVKACRWAPYAQIIWKSVTHVACAMYKHSFTCEYGPGIPCMIPMARDEPGRIMENVLPPIKPLDECMAGDR